MSIDSILSLIDAEIASLTQVRSLLSSTGKVESKVAELTTKKTEKAVKAGRKKRRKLSPEARKRIADAQRKRWAALKAKSK
jgi:acyl-CoA reductase-like NAD-dependent aldehyde dehydrogenase